MSERFAADWLTLREGFDAAARSTALALQLGAVLPARPRLLDLGAGTGSLFRWLAPLLARPQHWTLCDADPELLARALDDTAAWGAAMGFFVEDRGQELVLHTPAGEWRVSVLQADLAVALPLAGQHAVVCSALLDLVSRHWLERLADRLAVPLLACLSVDGRDAFLPPLAGDSAVRAGFRRDQGRDKGFGAALGPAAQSVLRQVLGVRGFAVQEAGSDWRIPRHATAMLAALVDGHAGAAARHMPARGGAIAVWRAARLRQIGRQLLAIRIGHRDSLALPPGR
jgi:SAM-dependent methyltransferase